MNIEPKKYRKIAVLERDITSETAPGLFEWTEIQRNQCDHTGKEEKIVPTQGSAYMALRYHPYLKDCLAFSILDECVMLMRPLPCLGQEIPPNGTGRAYPRRYDSDDLNWLMMLLNNAFENLSGQFKKTTVDDAVRIVAHQNAYNPIQVYLDGLTWDEKPRLREWLHRTLGAEQNDLTATMGRKFLIGAVRRVVKREGYKFDSMLILEGEKGIQKSSMCRILFGDQYFMEGIGSLKSPTLAEKLSGLWGIEIPELQGFKGQDAQLQKEFLSKVSDTYRRPYMPLPSTYPRRCVFVGTVNDDQYIQEKGADRRFWPVACNVAGPTNLQWLKDNRDQLWAEAYAVAKSPTLDYLTSDEMEMLAEAQEGRTIIDPWETLIQNWLDGAGKEVPEIHMNHILTNVLGVPTERQDRKEATKLGFIFKNLGLKRERGRRDGRLSYYYTRT